MKKYTVTLLIAVVISFQLKAQVKIGDNPGTISQGSLLELESTSRALTLPRMTTVQMQAIPTPVPGMIVFNIDSNCLYLYRNNNSWSGIKMDASEGAQWPYYTNDNNVGTQGNKVGIIAATGTGLIASGDYSHAEGTGSIASGAYGFAFGQSDTAASTVSVAMGASNKSTGAYGFALGYKNITAYQSSVTMGQENKDTGWASLASGIKNNIFNNVFYSNAFGLQNEIRAGQSNNLLGESNILKSGRANILSGYANNIDAGNFISLVGTNNNALGGNSHFAGGENNSIKSGNANSLLGRGNTADGSYLSAFGKDNTVYYQSAVALGQANTDSGWASLAGGLSNNIKAGVQYSAVFGSNNRVNAGTSNFAAGELNIITNGSSNSLLGYSNSSENSYNILAGNDNTVRTGNANSVFGQNNISDGSYNGSIGKDNIVFGQGNMSLGLGNKDSGYASLAGGFNNIINNGVQYSAVMGTANQVSGGFSNIALGENNIIKPGRANSAFGQNNALNGNYLSAMGKDNIVYYQSAVALGQSNADSGWASLAGGLSNNIRSGVQYSNAFGFSNQVRGGSSHNTLGETNIIKNGRANTSVGYNNNIENGNFISVLGTANNVLAGSSHIAGGENNTIKNGNANSLFGQTNTAEGSYLGAIGKDNSVYYQSAVALGQANKDSGWATIAGGLSNTVNAGVQYSALFGTTNRIGGGTAHMLMGESNLVNAGRANTVAGYANNVITGNFISAFGTSNDVLAGNSHFTGGENNTIKSGNANSVFGQTNTADGSYLGAIGKDNSVYYQSSVALGQSNKDSGWASIAGGLANTIEANTQYNAVFGANNVMTRNLAISNAGQGNFSAGLYNINSGSASIALGARNRPSNQFSLAANYNNLANSFGMSAFGHFNDTIPALPGGTYQPNEMLFSIGNGTGYDTRRNSLTMMRNGFTTINATEDLGANVPRAELDVKGTGAIIVPVGTTAQRPVTPVVGMIRFCTDCPGGPVLQGYDGTNWVNL